MSKQDELAGLGERLYELLKDCDEAAAAWLSAESMQGVVEELLADAATQAWIAQQMEETRLKTLDFRNGTVMELEPARDLAATWVAAARGLILNAENYTETVYTDSHAKALNRAIRAEGKLDALRAFIAESRTEGAKGIVWDALEKCLDLPPAGELVTLSDTVVHHHPEAEEPGKGTSYSMGVGIPELPERYTLTVQRIGAGKVTPHEGRMQAEAERGRLSEIVWQWIENADNGNGADRGDLIHALERNGFSSPSGSSECDE